MTPPNYELSPQDRILIWVAMHHRVHKRDDDCWEWKGSTAAGGAPVVRYKNARYNIQRLMCRGVLPRLICGTKGCINPEHMRTRSGSGLLDSDKAPKARMSGISELGTDT